jgi:DNA-binding LacI/PurR family transcriptional regulator
MARPPQLAPDNQQPTYRRIANGLRDQIMTGQLAPGKQLPSQGKLIKMWRSSAFTIHTAVQTLIKEGWVESIRGAGTYVARLETRFTCAGIYHGTDIFAREEAAFSRALHNALLDQLGKLGKETLVFVDSRPQNKQGAILPALAEAILHRRIQCLIAPTLNPVDSRPLARIRLPTAFVANAASFHRLDFDRKNLLRDSIRSLAGQGCRSVGLISTVALPGGRKGLWRDFYTSFRRAVHAEGLTTHTSWIREPMTEVPNLERYGYEEFKNLWALPKKPDGLIVYPDVAARGTMTAILKLGLKIPEELRVVFHRNAHERLLCPFPVTWAVSDEAQMAARLIQMIEKQFMGELVTPDFVPHSFESWGGED